jgi:CRISPR-associated protein (TIGR03984 family)
MTAWCGARRTKDGDWVTSDAVLSTSPALKGDYLWSARLFNAQREILLWRDGDGNWQAREIADEMGEGEPAFVEWYDEPQLLWGDHGKHEVSQRRHFYAV